MCLSIIEIHIGNRHPDRGLRGGLRRSRRDGWHHSHPFLLAKLGPCWGSHIIPPIAPALFASKERGEWRGLSPIPIRARPIRPPTPADASPHKKRLHSYKSRRAMPP